MSKNISHQIPQVEEFQRRQQKSLFLEKKQIRVFGLSWQTHQPQADWNFHWAAMNSALGR
jgi:hypothetical protein